MGCIWGGKVWSYHYWLRKYKEQISTKVNIRCPSGHLNLQQAWIVKYDTLRSSKQEVTHGMKITDTMKNKGKMYYVKMGNFKQNTANVIYRVQEEQYFPSVTAWWFQYKLVMPTGNNVNKRTRMVCILSRHHSSGQNNPSASHFLSFTRRWGENEDQSDVIYSHVLRN